MGYFSNKIFHHKKYMFVRASVCHGPNRQCKLIRFMILSLLFFQKLREKRSSMHVGVRSMPGLVKSKIVFTLPDVPFVQSRSVLGMVVFRT